MTAPCRPPQPSGAAVSAATPPGTLMWIGSRTHGEMVHAFRECEATAPQIALRATVAEAVSRPAGLVRQIIVARPDRSPADRQPLESLRALYPDAQLICLLGSGCEGERRTGQPWPGFQRVYWHQWNQHAPTWLGGDAPTADRKAAATPGHPAMALVLADRMSAAAPLLDLMQSIDIAAVWLRPGQQAAVRRAAVVLWDDSAAPPAPRHVWRRRLAALAGATGQPRHFWLVGFPRLHEWTEACRGGIDMPISKPYEADALRRWVLTDLS